MAEQRRLAADLARIEAGEAHLWCSLAYKRALAAEARNAQLEALLRRWLTVAAEPVCQPYWKTLKADTAALLEGR